MKILKKIIVLIRLQIMFFSIVIKNQINTIASFNVETNTRNIANVAVLVYSFDNRFM